MTTKFFDSIIMLRFVKKKMTKEEFYDKKNNKNNKNNKNVNVYHIVISKIIWVKNNSRYLIGYFDVIKQLALRLPKTSKYISYIKIF